MQIEIVVFYLCALEIFLFLCFDILTANTSVVLIGRMVTIFALFHAFSFFLLGCIVFWSFSIHNGFGRSSSLIWFIIIYLWIGGKKCAFVSQSDLHPPGSFQWVLSMCNALFVFRGGTEQNNSSSNSIWNSGSGNNSFSLFTGAVADCLSRSITNSLSIR